MLATARRTKLLCRRGFASEARRRVLGTVLPLVRRACFESEVVLCERVFTLNCGVDLILCEVVVKQKGFPFVS